MDILKFRHSNNNEKNSTLVSGELKREKTMQHHCQKLEKLVIFYPGFCPRFLKEK